MRILSLYLFLCKAVVTCHVYGQDIESSGLEGRFRDEAPLGWNRLKTKHDQTCFDWTQTSVKNARGKQTVLNKSGSNCYCGTDFQIRLQEDGAVVPEVWGGNDRYLFTVTRSLESSPWQLRHFGPRSDNSRQNGDVNYGFQTRHSWCIFDVPFSVLASDPSFKVESIIQKSDGSVDVSFSVNPSNLNTDERKPDVASGEASLLPDRDWAIASYNVKLIHPNRAEAPVVFASASVEYGPEEDGFLNIVRTSYEFHWQAEEGKRATTLERDIKCRPCKLSPESFTLAAFDVPEPALLSESNARSKSWLLWLNITAIVFLVLAFILRSRLKNREA